MPGPCIQFSVTFVFYQPRHHLVSLLTLRTCLQQPALSNPIQSPPQSPRLLPFPGRKHQVHPHSKLPP